MAWDPYSEWLGIPCDRRPPAHYDLLGLPPGESNQERIRQAVEARYELVRSHALGPQREQANRILNEIAQAGACLTDAERKAEYDRRQLRRVLQRSIEADRDPAHFCEPLGRLRLSPDLRALRQALRAAVGELASYEIHKDRAVAARIGKLQTVLKSAQEVLSDPKELRAHYAATLDQLRDAYVEAKGGAENDWSLDRVRSWLARQSVHPERLDAVARLVRFPEDESYRLGFLAALELEYLAAERLEHQEEREEKHQQERDEERRQERDEEHPAGPLSEFSRKKAQSPWLSPLPPPLPGAEHARRGPRAVAVKALLAVPKSIDFLLRKTAGEDNHILHNFLRLMLAAGIVVGVVYLARHAPWRDPWRDPVAQVPAGQSGGAEPVPGVGQEERLAESEAARPVEPHDDEKDLAPDSSPGHPNVETRPARDATDLPRDATEVGPDSTPAGGDTTESAREPTEEGGLAANPNQQRGTEKGLGPHRQQEPGGITPPDPGGEHDDKPPPTAKLPSGGEASAGSETEPPVQPQDDRTDPDPGSVAGTTWAGTDSYGHHYVFSYLPGGILRYTSPSGTFNNGTWRQNGDRVYMEMNDRYSQHEGVIRGSKMSGAARNVKGDRWTWSVERQSRGEPADARGLASNSDLPRGLQPASTRGERESGRLPGAGLPAPAVDRQRGTASDDRESSTAFEATALDQLLRRTAPTSRVSRLASGLAVHIDLPAKDGLMLKAEFYLGTDDKDTVPVLLLHGWKGDRMEFAGLAAHLQRRGHAVLVPDLRGHGESIVAPVSLTGTNRVVDAAHMTPEQFASMALYDLEVWRTFLAGMNDRDHLNLNKLCIVGAEMGAALAAYYALHDCTTLRREAGRAAPSRDVKAIVLISPDWDFHGMPLNKQLGNMLGRSGVAMMIVVGKGDRDSLSHALRLRNLVKRFHRSPADDEAQGLLFVEHPTDLQGTNRLRVRELRLPEAVAQFIEAHLVDPHYPWYDRGILR
jgi:pimeloyl-ACP methyl ester carboxylesterase